MKPALIYSSGNNITMQQTALAYGLLPGAGLPCTVYTPPVFCDMKNWRNPNRSKYMNGLAEHRPQMAVVIDWVEAEQYKEVISWAEEAAQYVTQAVIIVAKVHGGIERLPRMIDSKEVRLGYSVPTSHGGTTVAITEFQSRPVHLLGGDPDEQIRLSGLMDVLSVDNNYIQEMAGRAQFRAPGIPARRWGWPNLKEWGLGHIKNAPYLAFELSCMAVTMLWDKASTSTVLEAQYERLSAEGYAVPKTLSYWAA